MIEAKRHASGINVRRIACALALALPLAAGGARAQPSNANGYNPAPAAPVPVVLQNADGSVSGGAMPFRVNSAAGTNAISVKAAPGRLYAYVLCNTAGSARYVRFFNLATIPVPGTSPVAAGGIAVAAGSCQSFSSSIGLVFTAGIGFDITGAAGDADATAVAASDVSGFLGYQ